DESKPDSKSEDDGIHKIETWNKVVDRVTDITRKAFHQYSGTLDTAACVTAFQSHWRGIFTTLSSEIAADATIPTYLTSPPVKKFEINLFTEDGELGCPCCLPDVQQASITLENENGVTKEDFMRGLTDYLYNRRDGELPMIYSKEKMEGEESDEAEFMYDRYFDREVKRQECEGEDYEETVFEYKFPALVYTANWMSGGGSTEEGKHVYGNFPSIWLYCCLPQQFE
ncbi:hypothetical protein B0H66DRAFT_457315, partial [Apodospora peruviana]